MANDKNITLGQLVDTLEVVDERFIDEDEFKELTDAGFVPLTGGDMTGTLGLKQGGVGLQLGTSGNICATDTHNGGGTTRTILGAGIHWATDAATEDEMTVGHPLFHLAMRGSSKRPTYCAGTNKNNNTELALLEDIPELGYSTPEMHGAIGDGVNDDAGAFANAINDSDYVFLTSDLYLLSPVAISGKTRLVVDGNGYTINYKNIERALQITDSTNIIFRNIIFDGNSCTTQGVLFINCENIQVEKCTFKNMTTTSETDGDTWGLNFRDSKDMRVDFCSFLNIDGSGNSTKVANGIVVHGHTKGCENVTISNCYFDTILPVNDACGISLNQAAFYDTPLYAVVENCRFIDCAKRAVKIMAQNVTVKNCDIKDVLSTDVHASMIDIMASHCRVANNTINVNSATYGISCQYVAETSTITGFTDIVIENNYINVANADGTTARDGLTVGLVNETKLYEDIVVKNNIVKGAFRYAFKAMYIANSVIDGNTFEGEVRIGNRSLNDRPCSNNRVVNNTMTGTLEFSVAHSLLAHNEFVGNGGFGIYYSTFTNGSPSNLRIVGNSFNNMTYGIHAGKQAMDNVIITDNVFTDIATLDMLLNGTNYVLADNVLCKGVSGTFEVIADEEISALEDAISSHTSNKSNPHGVTAAQVGAVPTTRKVNGKALSEDITLTADDVGAIGEATVTNAVSAHNTNTSAHNDIRELITALTTRLNALADSDDTTLDQMSEVVAYIKSNESLIDAITTAKISYTDIVNDLVTNNAGKPLSAAQGVALKALIDTVSASLTSHTGNKSNPHVVTADQVGALPLVGGKMTGTIDFDGTSNILDFGTAGWFRGRTTSGGKYDIFGYSDPTTLQVGGSYPALALRGKNDRPTYNGANMALLSDIAKKSVSISLAAASWTSGSGITDYPYKYTLSVSGVTADSVVELKVDPASMSAASDCGMCPTCDSGSGTVTFYSVAAPTSAITGTLHFT